MANYATSTSDKSKKKAIIRLLLGGIGLHLFYVGRIKAGFIRLFFGFLFWSLIIAGISDGAVEMILPGILFLIAFNIADLIKLLLGTFRDNIGNPLRE